MNISLVIPVYNEEANIQKGVFDKIGNFTVNKKEFIEVIIIDDGSTDLSKNIIKERYLPLFPKFKLVENIHQGKAYAVITGIKRASGNFVMFSDVDLATPIEEAETMISEAKKGNNIIIGSRNSGREGAPILRKLMAKGFILIRDLVIGLNGIKDTQCGFKLFEKKAAITILSKLQVFKHNKLIKGSSVSAGFDLEFLFVASRLGYKIKEVPVAWRHVETKNVNFIKDSLETLRDMTKIKYYSLMGRYKKNVVAQY